ncbi:hypothetical protein DPMN_162203 [Dreissena polymorpha]|uniref:Uncharacterized protein n=1 Tax=Dreissena polymorpha TaxID=45954 RepID=A0A9D4IRT5_DREPO|nr:hypothetical protein DPMN_162203 [Dreissena polymorpha]
MYVECFRQVAEAELQTNIAHTCMWNVSGSWRRRSYRPTLLTHVCGMFQAVSGGGVTDQHCSHMYVECFRQLAEAELQTNIAHTCMWNVSGSWRRRS